MNVFLCGVCHMAQDGLRWHCRGCGGHHVVTDAACDETGTARPGVRMVTMPPPEYRVVASVNWEQPHCRCGHRMGGHSRRAARPCMANRCPCLRFVLAEALV